MSAETYQEKDTHMKKTKQIAGFIGMMAIVMGGMAEGVELKELKLPMTRDEADSTLSKDYQYTILSDGTLRRTWKLKGRKVHVDFKLNRQGQAICIAVEYTKPASQKTVHNDIKAVTAGKSSYKKLGKPKKNTNTYGMQHALGAKVKSADGKNTGWIFVEHTHADRKKCTGFVYYAAKPTRDRRTLSEAQEDAGYTAMGSAGANIDLSALKADEEDRRRTTAAKPTQKPKERPALADTPDEAVAATETADADDGFGAPEEGSSWEDDEDTATAQATSGKGFLPEAVAPVRQVLMGLGVSALVADIILVLVPLLLLLLVVRAVRAKSRAKKSRAAFENIMNRNNGGKQE